MQLTCDDFGLWAFDGGSSSVACSGTPTINLWGFGSPTIGQPLYTGSPCNNPADLLIIDGFYSNGAVWIQYAGSPQFEILNIGSCATPTPSLSPTPTPTPTPSPTPLLSDYCIINTTTFDGNYYSAGTYNSNTYFTGSTGYIFYSSGETRWCLAANLGDPCTQFGPYNSSSVTPDLDDTVMYSGVCVTTTTTTNPCLAFDFDAIFDCFVPATPSPTPTSTATPTPTPTPTSSNPCGGVSILATASGYTPTPTPTMTPTPSPSPDVTRPCNFSGEVIFNAISETLECANSKKFKDCFTGIDYYTSGIVLVSGTTSPKEGYVYNATINGQGYCVVYEGLFENISGNDDITLTNEIGSSVNGACLNCIPNLTSTPTPTPTQTPTPTPSSPPCILFGYIINNQNISPYVFDYITCDGPQTQTIQGYGSSIICTSVVPTTTSPNITITPLGSACL